MTTVTELKPAQQFRKTELSAIKRMIEDGKKAPQVAVIGVEGLVANYLLSLNHNNRPLRSANLEKLVGVINRDEWRMNGASIVVSNTGILLDGQHRLAAIAKTTKTLPLVFVTGAEDQAFYTIDQGRMRNLADLLGISGPTGDPTYASAVRLLYLWYSYPKTFTAPTRSGVSSGQLLQFASKLEGLEHSVAIGRHCKKQIGGIITPAIYAAAHYEAVLTHEDDAEEFFSLLASGANLDPSSPILVLRNQLLRIERVGSRSERRYIIAIIAKAWNAWRDGNSIKQLRFGSGEEMPEFL